MLRIKPYEVLIIILLSILTLLPFANQAFNIDDDIYLNAAIKYNESGFQSLRGQSEQEGIMYPNYLITHPLLWPWFLALFMKLFNTKSEIVLHLISIINLIIIGLSAISISRRYSKSPLMCGILFLLMPAVILMSHTMMTDIPTLAFFLLALSLHIEGVERNSILTLIFSGIAAAISAGISYQALLILILFGLYNYQKKEKNIYFYVSSAIPLFCFVIWCLYTWREFGIAHPFIAFQWAGMASRDLLSNFFAKLISNINSIGAALIFPLFILVVYFFQQKFRKILFISFIISIITILIFAANYSLVQKVLFVIYFTAGFFILLRIIFLFLEALKLKDKKNIFITFWFLSFFLTVALIMPLGVSRYLLPALLPIVIIILNDLNEFFNPKHFKYAIALGISSTLIWGILCSIADYNFNQTYRDFSRKMKEDYKTCLTAVRNQNVWFCTDGLKWYMEKHGFKPLLFDDSRVKENDIIVISTELWAYKVPEIMENCKLINKIKYDSHYPIRTMNLAAHAGFYDQGNALLPISITRGPYEEFSIYKVISND